MEAEFRKHEQATAAAKYNFGEDVLGHVSPMAFRADKEQQDHILRATLSTLRAGSPRSRC